MESAPRPVPPRLLLGLGVLLLPFSFIPGACDETVTVLQFPESLSVAAGKQATLNCTLPPGFSVNGPVRWYKGSGTTRLLIFSVRNDEGSFPRISRLSPDSNTDFNITISNISTNDTGTYYCVKFRINTSKNFTSLKGTTLSVSAPPSAPDLSSPKDRAEIRTKVNFTCASKGFVPSAINVTWLKDDVEISDAVITQEFAMESSSFQMKSRVTVVLGGEDIKSRITCRVMHDTLSKLLEATANLSDVIKVSPSVNLHLSPGTEVLVNGSVTINCSVPQFYPQTIAVSIQNSQHGTLNVIPENIETIDHDGIYSLRSSLQLNATEQWNQSVFTCKVRHLDKEFKSKPTVLVIVTENAPKGDPSSQAAGLGQLQYSVIAACLALLVLLVIAIVLFMRTKKKRDKDTANRRSMRSSQRAQAPEAKDITYADLEFQQRRPNRRSPSAQNDHCEYASVQTGPQPQKDNLTYADLDTVQLNQGPRKARASPAADHSEYAEVQIRKQ